jgi:hypothetical protein
MRAFWLPKAGEIQRMFRLEMHEPSLRTQNGRSKALELRRSDFQTPASVTQRGF